MNGVFTFRSMFWVQQLLVSFRFDLCEQCQIAVMRFALRLVCIFFNTFDTGHRNDPKDTLRNEQR